MKVITINNLHKRFDRLSALDGVSFDLAQGEVMGLFGHNGAGKSTLIKTILGIIEPTSGEVAVMGVSPNSKPGHAQRHQIGYLPENVSFYDQLTGLEILTFFARLKGFGKNDAHRLLKKLGLEHAMNRKVKTYSKGMRQRLGLSQAMLGSPRLLLLDEPTVGLDPVATGEFYQSLDELKASGCSIILCSHVLPGIEQHIDKALILSKGRQLALGNLDELRSQAQLPVAIGVTGLTREQLAHAELSEFIVKIDHISIELQVPAELKMHVMRKLLINHATDIRVQEPNFESLYLNCIHGARSNRVDAKDSGGQLVSMPIPNNVRELKP